MSRRRSWTAREDAILRDRYPHERTADIARDLRRSRSAVAARAYTLALRKSEAFLASPLSGRLQPDDTRGVEYRFTPGHTPATKGLRRPGYGPGRMKATQFKPGNRTGAAARNWCPIGTIRPDPEGYLRIKVREARPGERTGFGNSSVWPFLHRYRWEQVHGPVPAGYALTFRDRNRKNCDLSNIELVSRGDLLRRNSVHTLPEELRKVLQVLGMLRKQIRRRTTNGEKQDRRPA